MPDATHRIAPLDPPYTPEIARILFDMMGRRDEPPPLALFRTLMAVPELGSRIMPLGSFFLSKGALSARIRELVIHRVTARLGAEYEWGVHASLFGKPLGFGEAWLRATVHGAPGDPAWDTTESAVVQATDELLDRAAIDHATWEALAGSLSRAQLLEFLMLVGWYHLIAFVANAVQVPPEPWAERFPA